MISSYTFWFVFSVFCLQNQGTHLLQKLEIDGKKFDKILRISKQYIEIHNQRVQKTQEYLVKYGYQKPGDITFYLYKKCHVKTVVEKRLIIVILSTIQYWAHIYFESQVARRQFFVIVRTFCLQHVIICLLKFRYQVQGGGKRRTSWGEREPV